MANEPEQVATSDLERSYDFILAKRGAKRGAKRRA